jgi:cysteine desulfuration protein SufE
MSINEVQDEIINEFHVLDGDMEMTVLYLMELGQRLPDFPENQKTELNEVKGCQSKVWMLAADRDGRVYFEADSNTAITKGLVSLLIRIFSGQTAEDILKADLYFMKSIGMERFIGTQRSNGFGAMIRQMKLYALAFKTRAEVKS